MCPHPFLHILSALIVHLCFVSANLFIYSKTKHLGEPASAAQVIFCAQFPVACCILDPLLWHSVAHFLSPPISTATFHGHARLWQSPPSMLWGISTLLFLSVIQEAELMQIPEQLQKGEYTAFKLWTAMLRPHPLGSAGQSGRANPSAQFLQCHWYLLHCCGLIFHF